MTAQGGRLLRKPLSILAPSFGAHSCQLDVGGFLGPVLGKRGSDFGDTKQFLQNRSSF